MAISGTTDLGSDIGGGGGGVSSLNALTGALTLLAGSGISITPGAGTLTIAATGAGSGTVTSVDVSVPAYMTISGNPITTSGTLAFNFANQTTNKVFAAPNGSTGAPSFRLLVAADIPSLSYVSSVSGTAPVVSSGGLTPVISMHVADATHDGYLSSTDWNTFNNKLASPVNLATQVTGVLPVANGGTNSSSFIEGSVIFAGAGGTSLTEDNIDLNWDNTGKTLALGGVFGPPGTVPYAQTSQRTATNPSGIDGAIFGIHYSNNSASSGSLNTSGYFEARIQIDAGISTAANAGVIFQAYRNNGAPDAGSLGFLVGAFGGAHQIGTDPAATTDILAGVLSQVDISSGVANKAADFYGLAGTNGGTLTTGQFGIYIEPPGAGVKDNWLSGKALIGGSSYASHPEILKIAGDMSATISATDSGVSAGIFNASSDTTVDGSNTTLGINGVVSGTVQAGAENDKVLGAMNFVATRGDGTDDGILDAMTGVNVLLFHNSGGAGVTQKVYGISSIFFSEHGTATDLYDFFSQRVPAGDGVVTNHYGVYITADSDSPVQNWLSGRTQISGTSFGLSSVSAGLEISGNTQALLLSRMVTGDRDGLTAVNGMMLYNADTNKIQSYENGAWIDTTPSGASGSFTSVDLKTVTVVNGIITSIV